jgi:hypothetical protein
MNNSEDKNNWEYDGDLDYIYDYLIECMRGWEPKARIIGNARAEDIINALEMMKERWGTKNSNY